MSRPEPLTREGIQDLDRDELEDVALEQSEEIADLWDAVQDLRQTVESNHDPRIEAFGKQVEMLKTAIAGSPEEFAVWDVEEIDPLRKLVLDISEEVEDHEERLQMVPSDDGKASTPDERAIRLRQVLLNQTKGTNDDHAGMSRSKCSIALSGDLHKGSVLDAMRRAANGREADIDGSSDLEPVDAITFERGGTVGSGGDAEQSVVMIDRSRLTDTESRQILTTGNGGEGR